MPMASLADLVPVTSDGAAIGAGLSADDESFGYHRLLGMTGRRSEKKPVLELAEADLRSAAEMLERAGEERMGSRPDNTGDELLAHHAAPRGLALPAGEWAEPDVFADPRMFHELIGPRRSAPAASEDCGEVDPGEAGSGEPQAESTGPIWTNVAWRAPETGDAAVDLPAAESDLEEGTGWAGHRLTQSPADAPNSSLSHMMGLLAGEAGQFIARSDGSLDFAAIVKKLAGYGYEGWFVVEAEQDPKKAPPLKMAQVGHKELMRVMTAAGYEVVA